MILSEAREMIVGAVKDEAGKLTTPDDYDFALKKALARYSQYRPRRISQTVATGANGEILTSAITDFDEGFIDRLQIEYPIATTSGTQTFLDSWQWEYQLSDSGMVIRFLDSIPAVGVNVRIIHRVKHSWPTSEDTALTVPEADTEAVCSLAIAECLQILSNLFTQTVDKYPQADFTNFSTKGQDYSYRAKNYRDLFDEHF